MQEKYILYDLNQSREFLKNDFISLWNASFRDSQNRTGAGNFNFGLLALLLLELICRSCGDDEVAIGRFSTELNKIDSRYFVSTGLKDIKSKSDDFCLPILGECKDSFIRILYDTVRHGQAHRYQQIIFQLQDGIFYVVITGPEYLISESMDSIKRRTHLNLIPGLPNNRLVIQVLPDVLFSDFWNAAEKAHVFDGATKEKFSDLKMRNTDLEAGVLYENLKKNGF